MPLKNKTMALIRLRKTPYSGLHSFFQDVFYKQDAFASKALTFLKIIYKDNVKATDWKSSIKKLFDVNAPTIADERVIDEACFKYLGFHREDIKASKARLRGKKAYKNLLERNDLPSNMRKVLKKVSQWNSAVTSYYSILNKLKALGFIEKNSGVYVKSDKFKRRFSQVLSMIEGFENEIIQKKVI